MKPRLKYTVGGQLLVISPGLNPWAEDSARKFLVEHYGSIAAFASRFGFPYRAVCTALGDSYHATRMAGNVATVRQALGLPSYPTKQALAVACSQKLRKEAR